jgi:tetratricopeptide (TPR) repeat protein
MPVSPPRSLLRSFVPALTGGLAAVALATWTPVTYAAPAATELVHPLRAASSAHGPLETALAAARATDYVAAEKGLLAVTGADQGAARLALARIRFEQGRDAEAMRDATAAMADASQRLAALALTGQILASQGKVAEAIARLDPEKDGAGTGGRRVRLVLGQLLIDVGRRADAEPILLKFADEYGNDSIPQSDAQGLAMVGRAMHLLRHPKDANRAFNESERAERGRVETLLWRADLFIDKYDPGHAQEVLNEVLKVAPHQAAAKVLLARVTLEDAGDFDAAEALIQEALAVNPKLAGAYAVRAGMALRDENVEKADAAIDAGLAVAPGDLELLTLRAAARFVADDKPGFEARKRDVFARDKEFSEFYGIVGDSAEWEHRYAEIVAMMKDAVALDPDDAKAWAELGIMQTRLGDETEGVKSLQEAWKRDHFNVRVFNTLQLLYGDWVPNQYESARAGLFAMRYPKDKRALLERYVPRMFGEAWGAMKAHYMFTPAAPVAVELYRDREHFSVRTSGLPDVGGIRGICFGHVVAAMSPSTEPVNWGFILWHELAHVFALQISDNRVPRWFTEGLSEYETMIRRPEWRRDFDPQLYLAVVHDRLPGSVEMNSAFTHAGGVPMDVAYYAASQMIAFTAERFGFPAITRALALWGQGKATKDVIPAAFGVAPAEYDRAFHAWALARLSRYEGQYLFDPDPVDADKAKALVDKTPSSAAAHVTYAIALFRAHKADEARSEIEQAFKIAPDDKDAHYVASLIASAEKKDGDAEKHLLAIKAAGADGYTVEMGLAEAAQARHDAAAQRAALEAAHRFDPTQPDPLRGLYEIADAQKQDADALDALRALSRVDPHDGTAWRLLLARLAQGKLWDEAARTGEAALFVDLESAAIHVDYARALSATGDHAKAAFELESALLCDQKPEEKSETQALLAAEHKALGR